MLLESFKIPSADFKLAEIAPTCQAARSPKATSGIDKTMLGAIPSVPKAYCRKKGKIVSAPHRGEERGTRIVIASPALLAKPKERDEAIQYCEDIVQFYNIACCKMKNMNDSYCEKNYEKRHDFIKMFRSDNKEKGKRKFCWIIKCVYCGEKRLVCEDGDIEILVDQIF